MDKFKEYEEYASEIVDVLKWNDLPNGKLYCDSTMSISPAHSTLSLERMGQQYCGGPSYYKCPSILTNEILRILANDNTIIKKAIANLIEHRDNKLRECKDYVNEYSDKIKNIEEASADD